MNEDRPILSVTELQPTENTFQLCIDYVDIAGLRQESTIKIQWAEMTLFNLYSLYAKIFHKRKVIRPWLLLTVSRKALISCGVLNGGIDWLRFLCQVLSYMHCCCTLKFVSAMLSCFLFDVNKYVFTKENCTGVYAIVFH